MKKSYNANLNIKWDTHAHIYKCYYEDINDVIDSAKENNVGYIINSAVDKDSMVEVLESVNNFSNVYASLGIHPEYAESYKQEDIDFLKLNLNNKKVLAIGEIGMDYHYPGYNIEKQKELFEKQLKIAEEYKIPVVIHTRDATKDTIDILKKYKVKGVIHSFSGSYETAMEYINMGFFLGINGVITFKNCNLKEVILKIGLDHLVLETDSPYLTPVPYRGKQNSPSHIADVAQFLADLFEVDVEYIANITTNNVERIFDKLQ